MHQTNLSLFHTEANVAGLVVGGGGLPAGYAANLASAARWSGCKTAIAGIDVWPAKRGAISETAIGQYLALFDFAAFRHEIGAAQTRGLGRGGTPIFHGADWALKLETDSSPDVVNDRKRVLVTLREFAVERVPYAYVSGVADILKAIERHGLAPVFLPFCFEDERFLSELALDRMAPVERQWWNPRRMKQLTGASGAMVSVGRLHPLVFAASTGVPALALRPPGVPLDIEFAASKIGSLCGEVGVPMADGLDGLEAFLASPKAADAGQVQASRKRLDAMIAELRKLFAK